jgi:hypothetical protein
MGHYQEPPLPTGADKIAPFDGFVIATPADNN